MRNNLPQRVKAGVRAVEGLTPHLARLEQQLVRLKADVRQAQQLAGLGTAAATIAHEVNNLLTPILSYADAALNSENLALKNKALATTFRNASMLVRMSERVLQIGAAKQMARQSVKVRWTADEAMACLCRDLSRDGITFINDVDDALTAWTDPLHLRQVLFNLFLNAREVMARSHGGRLRVTARSDDGGVVIEVDDTAGGIDPALLPHIFEPLTSAKAGTGEGQSRCSGLGLALCHDLVEENGGTLQVSTDEGVGSTFTITLPARADNEDTDGSLRCEADRGLAHAETVR